MKIVFEIDLRKMTTPIHHNCQRQVEALYMLRHEFHAAVCRAWSMRKAYAFEELKDGSGHPCGRVTVTLDQNEMDL